MVSPFVFHVVILEFLDDLHDSHISVVVIATATTRSSVHPMLLQSRGRHVFDKTIEISTPTLVCS